MIVPPAALAMIHGCATSRAHPETLAELAMLEGALRATTDHARLPAAAPRALRTPAADGARVTLTVSSAEAALLWACVALALWAEDAAG